MSIERKRPRPSALATELTRMEREELEERACGLGVSAADRTFTSSDGLRFILLDAAFQELPSGSEEGQVRIIGGPVASHLEAQPIQDGQSSPGEGR